MELYRDTHGHFVGKSEKGEQCPHDNGGSKLQEGLRKGFRKEENPKKPETEQPKDSTKWLNATDEEIERQFSDEELTRGTRVGGYVGLSRSKSAEASEARGSKPMSKWTREDLLDEILQDEGLEELEEEFGNLSFAGLKRVALYQDGWHHVGKFATPTDFWAVDSPANIVKRLRDEKNGTLDKDRLRKQTQPAPSEWQREQARKYLAREEAEEKETSEGAASEFPSIKAEFETKVGDFRSEVADYAKANTKVSKQGNRMIDVQKARNDGYETEGSPTNLSFVKRGIVGEPGSYPRIDLVYSPLKGTISYSVATGDWDKKTVETPEEAYRVYYGIRAKAKRLDGGIQKGFEAR